ncbi:hypothetical protein TorRG33x02_149460 [Trema orientale]|uniref:Uncharacterized protein n=1 Tax=Trema orientale TaxID=63057 RepID=A0A2P5EUS2_TREOI|nr:hypothetical protein TorRG33x02_149460 [Trema orientale]
MFRLIDKTSSIVSSYFEANKQASGHNQHEGPQRLVESGASPKPLNSHLVKGGIALVFTHFKVNYWSNEPQVRLFRDGRVPSLGCKGGVTRGGMTRGVLRQKARAPLYGPRSEDSRPLGTLLLVSWLALVAVKLLLSPLLMGLKDGSKTLFNLRNHINLGVDRPVMLFRVHREGDLQVEELILTKCRVVPPLSSPFEITEGDWNPRPS